MRSRVLEHSTDFVKRAIPRPGASECVWERDDALGLIRLFREASIPVFGVDVWARGYYDALVWSNNPLSVDPKKAESIEAYVVRSAEVATSFVREVKAGDGNEPLFGFTPITTVMASRVIVG